jgi:hypothetical protein
MIEYLEVLSPSDQQEVITRMDTDLCQALKAIECTTHVRDCYQFLELAAEIYINHDVRKSLIAAKYALQILEIDPDQDKRDRIIKCVIKALYKQILI